MIYGVVSEQRAVMRRSRLKPQRKRLSLRSRPGISSAECRRRYIINRKKIVLGGIKWLGARIISIKEY
jgi:hypothetical protein